MKVENSSANPPSFPTFIALIAIASARRPREGMMEIDISGPGHLVDAVATTLLVERFLFAIHAWKSSGIVMSKDKFIYFMGFS